MLESKGQAGDEMVFLGEGFLAGKAVLYGITQSHPLNHENLF